MDGDARVALHDPLLLRFFCEAYAGRKFQVGDTITEILRLPLFELYTERKIGEISERVPSIGSPNSVAERIELIASVMAEYDRARLTRQEVAKVLPRGETTTSGSLYRLLLDEDIIIEENMEHFEIHVNFVYEAFMEYVLSRTIRRTIERSISPTRAGILWYRQHGNFLNRVGVMGFYAAYLFVANRDAFREILYSLSDMVERSTAYAVSLAIENIEPKLLTKADVDCVIDVAVSTGSYTDDERRHVRVIMGVLSRVHPDQAPLVLHKLCADTGYLVKRYPLETVWLLEALGRNDALTRLVALNQRLSLKDPGEGLKKNSVGELNGWLSTTPDILFSAEARPVLESIAWRWLRLRERWHAPRTRELDRRLRLFSRFIDSLVEIAGPLSPTFEMPLEKIIQAAADPQSSTLDV